MDRKVEDRWVEETLHRGFRVRLTADRVLFDSETEHQRLIIFENADFGRVMMLDQIVQLTTKDEFVYHEMMSHVPLFAHGKARKALIVGGGDGGVLRECLRHPELEQVTLCEIDRGVIDLCRQHFPEVSAGAYDDPRTRIVIADGTKFVAETDERFDVIMIDSTDPVGPGAVLFTREFYAGLPALPRVRAGCSSRRTGCPSSRPPSSSRASAISASCSATPPPISPTRRAISAGRCPMAGPPTMRSSGSHKRRKIEQALRQGRRLPDALLAARRPRRRLRAADLCPGAGRGVGRVRHSPLPTREMVGTRRFAHPTAARAWADRRPAAGNRRRRRRSRRSSLR